mgnify:CR=1 FL=1
MDKLEGFKVLMAFIPIIWLLVSLAKIKMMAYRASAIALIVTAVIAVMLFAMPVTLAAQAALEGFMLALFPIIWVIVSALFVYNITLSTGSLEIIKKMLSAVSADRRIQALILAFAFGGFLEAVAGFGTAVAIPAGILIAMGFSPYMAATVCLIANTIPVAFGVLGVPVVTLAQVTALPLDKLSLYTAVQLIPFVIVLPFVLIYAVTGSFKNIKGVVGVSLFSGFLFALGQTITAMAVGPELAAVVGSLAALAGIILWIKIFPIRNTWLFEGEGSTDFRTEKIGFGAALKAWAPYALILLLVFATRFIPFLDFLNQYPFVLKQQFYFGPGGKALTFPLATSGGTILFVSAILGGFIQGFGPVKIAETLKTTIIQVKKTLITILAIVALAKIMTYSGMVNSVAAAFAAVSGSFYPLIAPMIGALGTFVTGSDTSSNVLFGNLQKQTAIQLNISQEWLAAANASGATAGKMISPQSISIAATSTGLTNSEGKMLSYTLKYCIIYVILMGILVFISQGIVNFL